MNKYYSKEELVGGLNKSLADQYQKDRDNLFNPKFNPEHIRDHYQEMLNQGSREIQEANNNYVPALKEDIVFGDDRWSARERFLNQKKQLYSAMHANYADAILFVAIDEIEQSITEISKPLTVDEESFKKAYAEYEQQTTNKIINKNCHIRQRQADEFKRRRSKFVGMFVPGVILFVLCLFGSYFMWRATAGLIQYAQSKGATFEDLFTKKYSNVLQYLGGSITLTLFCLIGIGMMIPFRVYDIKRKRYFKMSKLLTPMIKSDLESVSQELILEYNNKYQSLFNESQAYRKAAYDSLNGCLNVFKEERDKFSYETKYSFCRDFRNDKIVRLYNYMEEGVVDSYTGALQYYNNEMQKEQERQATEEYRKQMVTMNKEHFAKMESAAQDQAYAAAQQAEAAARQAAAAQDAAYYARIQAQESRKQTEEAKKQTKIIKKW